MGIRQGDLDGFCHAFACHGDAADDLSRIQGVADEELRSFILGHLDTHSVFVSGIEEEIVGDRAVDDADTAYEAFLAREAMGETGMTDGFAVPHAKSAAIRDAIVIVVKNDRPIEWPSFDEKPVDVAIALLVPDSDVASTHIKLLSKTAVLLMRDEFKNLVHGTDDPQAIADAINAGLNED